MASAADRRAPFRSLYDDADIFASAIARADRSLAPRRALSGITVPHHLLAADLIARTIRMVDARLVGKIVILFPDHFKRTRHPFATTRRGFQTVFGSVAISETDVALLLGSPDLVEDSDLFAKDHGIGAILPFIRHYLPGVEIVPIAVAIRSHRADWDRMAELLGSIAGPSTLIIQSTDFSHYLPLTEAVRRDQETLDAIAAGDLDAVAALKQPQNTDSRGAQYIQLKVQRDRFRASPVVLFNANSQAYSGEPEWRTTSYIVQTFEPGAAAGVGQDEDGSKVYCFAGDTFFGRTVAKALDRPGVTVRVRHEMQAVLQNCRLILNLEGVLLERVPDHVGPTKLAMQADLVLEWLRALGVVAVDTANNHAMDFGAEAFAAMARRLGDAGLKVLRHRSTIDLGSFRVIALTDLDNHLGLGSGVIAEADIAELGRSARPPVVAFLHWGTEFVARPGNRERALADSLAKGGVALIVGAHPHVAGGGLERVSGSTLSAFSLGNFVFDQTAKRASGSLLEVRVFDQGTFFARLIPIPNFFDRMRSRP